MVGGFVVLWLLVVIFMFVLFICGTGSRCLLLIICWLLASLSLLYDGVA